jgi:transcriptional regulator with XRE-family HTH domain
MSQSDLGAKVGMDRYAVSDIESGNRFLRAAELACICDVFHTSLDDMVGDQEPILLDAKVVQFDPTVFIPHATTPPR